MKHKWLLLLILLLPAMYGCNDTDDVQKIFTGKIWKLNYITLDSQNKMFDFWENAQQQEASLKKLNVTENYNIQFEGSVANNVISGNANGKTISSNFNGTWTANGESNKFSANIIGNGEDILAKRFLEGLNSATSYSGDSNNLFIYYKSGQQTFRMVFYVLK